MVVADEQVSGGHVCPAQLRAGANRIAVGAGAATGRRAAVRQQTLPVRVIAAGRYVFTGNRVSTYVTESSMLLNQ